MYGDSRGMATFASGMGMSPSLFAAVSVPQGLAVINLMVRSRRLCRFGHFIWNDAAAGLVPRSPGTRGCQGRRQNVPLGCRRSGKMSG